MGMKGARLVNAAVQTGLYLVLVNDYSVLSLRCRIYQGMKHRGNVYILYIYCMQLAYYGTYKHRCNVCMYIIYTYIHTMYVCMHVYIYIYLAYIYILYSIYT